MRRYMIEVLRICREDGFLLLLKDFVRYVMLQTLSFETCWRSHNALRPRLHSVLYDAPANPQKILRIDPNDVRYCAGGVRISHVWGLAQVERGDWDLRGMPFAENRTYQSLRQRFVQERAWEETDYVDNYTLDAGYNNDPQELIDVRCRYVDSLYEDIRENGYSLNSDGTNEKAPRRVDSFQEIEYLVAIGRDGSYLHVDGSHRISIAKILDLDEIPVMVAGRHAQWQEIRDEIATATGYDDLSERARSNLSHPDIADVLAENEALPELSA